MTRGVSIPPGSRWAFKYRAGEVTVRYVLVNGRGRTVVWAHDLEDPSTNRSESATQFLRNMRRVAELDAAPQTD